MIKTSLKQSTGHDRELTSIQLNLNLKKSGLATHLSTSQINISLTTIKPKDIKCRPKVNKPFLGQHFTVVIRTNRMWKSTNQKTSCSCLATHDPKMIDTSFESPKCRL